MTSWRDHINAGEYYTVLAEFDDGSAVCLAGFTGGGSEKGIFGGLTLMQIASDGSTTFRSYDAVTDWELPEIRMN